MSPSSRTATTVFAALLATLMLPVSGASAASYVTSESCRDCHEAAFERWRASHHFQAMREASEDTVVGDFDDSEFTYGGKRHRFFRREGAFFVETDNASGEMETFRIDYTFGFYPLQQYLIGFPDGRYQALNIVWDARPQSEGGQRWYHLYPDEIVDHEDGLHWTGAFQNWNSRCASCHSTGLKKRYQTAGNRYDTTWSEINVACEACHGPGSEHVEWVSGADGETLERPPGSGFDVTLTGKADWIRGPGRATAEPGPAGHPAGQIAVCGACHSRRSEMADTKPDEAYSNLFQLRLLEEPLYFPDGQIDEEVYVLGSFIQSKMYAAGVGCSNCHDAHSGELRASGNALCAQCHDPTTFDSPNHHFHVSGSEGAACVDCHMPERIYMGVDGRRDHSFRIPEPALSSRLGTPNACTRCHSDRDDAWAAKALDDHGVAGPVRARHASVLARARGRDSQVLPELLALANDPAQPAIVRATAILESARFPDNTTAAAVRQALQSGDDLVRAAAVRSLDWLDVGNRYALLLPLIDDSSRSVRVEVANRLADVPLDQVPPADREALRHLRNEYLTVLNFTADMPESLMNLGVFLTAIGQPLEAERAYRHALSLSPQFVPALLNLADLYRAGGLDAQAEPLLREAIARAPDQAPAHHALGLLQVRRGNVEAALEHLEQACRLEPDNPRFAYVLGVALHDQRRYGEAITVLESALQSNPGHPELTNALETYRRQQGDTKPN